MKIVVGGDFYPGRSVEPALSLSPEQLLDQPILDLFHEADLSILNLECPLTINERFKINKTGPHLRGAPQAAKWLQETNVELVTLANNHIMDFGKQGLKDTLTHLSGADVSAVGAGMNGQMAATPFIIEKQGVTLAILNFAENEWSTTQDANTPGANPIDPVANYTAIQEAKSKADFVLVITHGGHEMYRLPSLRMKKLLRFYVDAGANAVINHHTHCASGYEWYKDAPICYSVGNFLFANQSSTESTWYAGMLAVLVFSQDEVLLELKHFTQCENGVGVAIVNEQEAAKRAREIEQLNGIIQNEIRLRESFDQWIAKKQKMYEAYIEPHTFRVVQALQNRNWLPSFWNKRKKTYLLNLIRCESHREMLQAILENETSDTPKR